MAKREKFSWRKVVLEAFMIVLSVLLALFINEWKSNKNEERNTKLMMEHISAELVNNQKLVEELIPYHVSVLKKIQTAAFQDSLTYLFLRNGYFELSAVAPKGVIQGEFQNIAWSIAREERISNRISLDASQLIFSAYEQQERVLRTIGRIIDILGSREIHREELIEESAIVLALEWNEMIAQEEELKRLYTRTLKKLED